VKPGEEKAQEDLINVWKYLKGGCKEDKARILSVVPSDRTRGTGHKLKYRRFPLNIREHFHLNTGKGCTGSLWSLLPQMEIFRSHLDMVLGNWL